MHICIPALKIPGAHWPPSLVWIATSSVRVLSRRRGRVTEKDPHLTSTYMSAHTYGHAHTLRDTQTHTQVYMQADTDTCRHTHAQRHIHT